MRVAIAALCLATASCAAYRSPDEPCRGTFRWMQNDAYADVGGRNNDYWPPHTTTIFEVACGDRLERSFVMVNHGGPHDATDAAGTPILEEVGRSAKTGTRAELLAVGETIRDCKCSNEFLSTATVEEETERELIGSLAAVAERRLECPTADARSAVLEGLRAPDLERVIESFAGCSWEGGNEAAFDRALEAAGEKLEGYHVCNNDARLQAELWARFQSGRGVPRCEPAAAVCNGPLWFYEP